MAQDNTINNSGKSIAQSSGLSSPSLAHALTDDEAKVAYIELFESVRDSLGTGLDRNRIVQSVNKIIDLFVRDPYNQMLLLAYSSSKDNYILAHIANNVIISVGFGVSLGLSEDDLLNLGLVAYCHDFGMIDYTHLFQRGQQLTDHENIMIRKHPLKSVEMVSGMFSDKVVNAILDIHENVNGQGYPKGKSSAEISTLAKIVAVCDIFEALTHPRNFRKEITPHEALKVIIKAKDKIFDGKVIKKFVEFMSIYPAGSFVYLNTGEVGMVVGANKVSPTKPVVKILVTAKKEVETQDRAVDLLEDDLVYVVSALDYKDDRELSQQLNPRGEFPL